MQMFHPSSGLAGQSVNIAAHAKGKIIQFFISGLTWLFTDSSPSPLVKNHGQKNIT